MAVVRRQPTNYVHYLDMLTSFNIVVILMFNVYSTVLAECVVRLLPLSCTVSGDSCSEILAMKQIVEIASKKSLFQFDLPSKRAGFGMRFTPAEDRTLRRFASSGREIKAIDRETATDKREQSLASQRANECAGQVLQQTEANITDQTSLITGLIKSSLCVYDKRVLISSSLPILRYSGRSEAWAPVCNCVSGVHPGSVHRSLVGMIWYLTSIQNTKFQLSYRICMTPKYS